MDEHLRFRSAKRGYEPSEVDQAFAAITSQYREAEQSRTSAERTIARLTRELDEARAALKRANAKPSFADLGSAFEQTLRLAEEQAARMIAEAASEARAIRDSADSEADEMLRTARSDAESMRATAESAADELHRRVSRETAEMLHHAKAQLLEAQNTVSGAERAAATIRSEADRYASDLRARIHEETEEAKTELATLRQIAEREHLRIVHETKIARDEAERERLQMHEQMSALIQEQNAEADRVLAEAVERSAALSAEAAQQLTAARTEAADLLRSARQQATATLSQAQKRSALLSERSTEFAGALLAETETRLIVLEDQRRSAEAFSLELRALASADGMTVLDGSAE